MNKPKRVDNIIGVKVGKFRYDVEEIQQEPQCIHESSLEEEEEIKTRNDEQEHE